MSAQTHQFVINAWYYQFYLEDVKALPAYDLLWTDQTYADRVAVSPGIIAVGTARYGVDIPVTIEIDAEAPSASDDAPWDHIVECSISVPSGHLQITSPDSFGADVPQFALTPGTYRARIYYANLESIRGGGDLDGDDHYRILLWPGDETPPVVLKRKPVP
jgi:hypothetical protein